MACGIVLSLIEEAAWNAMLQKKSEMIRGVMGGFYSYSIIMKTRQAASTQNP
jgi:hypothetical protein